MSCLSVREAGRLAYAEPVTQLKLFFQVKMLGSWYCFKAEPEFHMSH